MALKFSADGLRSLERQLASLEDELRKTRIYKNKIAADNGNVWHDNNDFEQCEIEERRLMKEISDIKEKINNAEIISSDNTSSNIVNYGAIVQLRISEPTFTEDLTILFSDSDEKSNYEKVSVNSPLGKTIHMQKAGFTGSYLVAGNKITVEVLDVTYES